MRPNFVKTDGQVQKTVKPFVSIGLILKKKIFCNNFPEYSYILSKFSGKLKNIYWIKLIHKNLQNVAKRSSLMDLEHFFLLLI